MGRDPSRLVVDSSVAVKWYIREGEDHAGAAWDLLDGHLEGIHTLAAPEHIRLEVLNALRSRGFGEARLIDAHEQLELAGLDLRPVDAALTRSAATLAARHGLTLYDAAFAALALDLDAELVTADRRLGTSGACRLRLLGG